MIISPATDFFRKISIKAKLMLVAFILILLPIVILGYFGYRNYADVMKAKAIGDAQNTARELTGMLSERAKKLNLFAVQIFYDRTIYNAYSDLVSENMDSFHQNAFQQFLQSMLFSKYELDEVLVRFPAYGKVFQANRTSVAVTDSSLQFDGLHECALRGHGRPEWYVAQKNGRVTGLYLAKIIYDLDNIKKETGMLVFKVNEQYLTGVFDNFISNTNQNVSLFTGDGRAIFTHEAFNVNYEKALDEFLNSTSDTKVSDIKIKNDTAYLLYDTIHPMNWKLVIGISRNVLLKEVREIAGLILLLCAATLPVGLMLVNYLYIGIIKPMNLLIRKMRQLEKGDIGVVIESRRQDEFGYVFRTFNKMSQEIKNLINTVYKKQIAMKDAEIKALQAQINPHFLYNTLEAINWKARMHGADEISDMVSALSTIIEANLNRRNEKFIPVFREMEYIGSYTFLIQKRFGKKIKFDMHVEEDTFNCIIPKLMVQPLVENAVFHGLEMKKGGGTIDIAVEKEDDTLVITVADDGLGIDERALEVLRENLLDESYMENENPPADSAKIGVINVHHRIKLLYGEGYGLEISSEAGVGTAVTIKLPIGVPKRSEVHV